MTTVPADPLKIGALGWRQGSVLPPELMGSLRAASLLPSHEDENGYLVIGQDCDVVCPSFEVEPYCEVIAYKFVSNKDGNLVGGKSARKIHIPTTDGQWLECAILKRYQFPRQELIVHEPSSSLALSEATVKNLKLWLAKRYSRQSFPDEFNRRYRPKKDQIKREFKSSGHLLEDIYIQTSFEELPSGEEYEVVIVGVMLDENYDDEEKYRKAQESIDKVASMLEECPGIKAINNVASARRDISLSILDTMRSWDYLDSLSISS